MKDKTILLVEDDILVGMREERDLKEYGYRVIRVQSGEAAVDLFSNPSETSIDLVLMDIDLGKGMLGTEAAAFILDKADIPIVFLSSHTDQKIVYKTEKISSYGYVVKDSGITVLNASINMAFRLFESRQNSRNLERVVAALPTHVFRVREESGKYIVVLSEGDIAKKYRITTDEARGKELTGIFTEEHCHSALHYYKRAFAGEEPFFELRVGDSWLNTRLSPYTYDKTGKVTEIIGYSTDITYRKQMEEKLRRSEELLKRTEELTGVGGWEFDLAEQKMTWTDEVFRIYGLEPNEHDPNDIGQDIAFYSAEEQKKIEQAFFQAAEEGIPYDLELQFTSADGRRKWVRTLGTPVRREDRIVKVVGNLMDITDRKQIEEELRTERNRAQLFFDVAGIMFVVLNREGTITLMNRRGCEILGLPYEELIGKNWFDNFIPPENRTAVKKVFGEIIADRLAPREYYENPIINGGGVERQIYWHNAVLRDSEGLISGTLSSGLDITDRLGIEEDLQKALHEKQALLDELQHRIKNSFSMITSMIHLMKSEHQSDSVRAVLDELEGRTRAISEMYALLHQSDSVTEVRLDAYLNTIISSFPTIPEGISLVRKLDPITISAKHAVPLGIILTELTTNSLKYAFPDNRSGQISIFLEKTEHGGLLKVDDDGVGLPADIDAAQTDSVGLLLIRVLAEQIGAQLALENNGGVHCSLDFEITAPPHTRKPSPFYK